MTVRGNCIRLFPAIRSWDSGRGITLTAAVMVPDRAEVWIDAVTSRDASGGIVSRGNSARTTGGLPPAETATWTVEGVYVRYPILWTAIGRSRISPFVTGELGVSTMRGPRTSSWGGRRSIHQSRNTGVVTPSLVESPASSETLGMEESPSDRAERDARSTSRLSPETVAIVSRLPVIRDPISLVCIAVTPCGLLPRT